MTALLWIVVKMTVLTLFCLLAASLMKAKAWTPPGFLLALGNRENMPEPSAVAGRADRTARNTLEAFALFTALALVAHGAGKNTPAVLQGAEIFFWSRVIYIPVYVAGLTYVRTAVWTAGMVGLGLMIIGLT